MSMNGEVGHFEIPAKDFKRAKMFYSQVFGWKINESHMSSGETYTSLQTTEVDSSNRPKSPGVINGGLVKMRDPNTAPVITIVADDIDASLESVEKNGGKTVVKRTEMEQYGAYAYFMDTEGNVMGLYEYPKT
jgi:predicted enzyme related to lactoylglutathione lyase